jgi:tripartite-type tricarboxylate transporter receptor subunit TctC
LTQPIVDKLHADINEALRDPEVKKKLENLSAEVSTASLAETAAFFKAEIETWHNVIRQANVKLEQ